MAEFKITGPGRYRMRNGEIAKVITGWELGPWFWDGYRTPERNERRFWGKDGTADSCEFDIISGPLPEDEPLEMAGLTGYAVWTQGGATLLTANYNSVDAIPSMYTDGKIIDLSKFRLAQS